MNPQNKTNIASGPVYGMLIINPIHTINTAELEAIMAWPPTKEQIGRAHV
jgi:hypothetical protein